MRGREVGAVRRIKGEYGRERFERLNYRLLGINFQKSRKKSKKVEKSHDSSPAFKKMNSSFYSDAKNFSRGAGFANFSTSGVA